MERADRNRSGGRVPFAPYFPDERAIRPVTITRKNSLFAGSDAGARHRAIANTLIQSCTLNGVEALAYLTDVLQRIVSGRTTSPNLHTLLPWNWRPPSTDVA